MLYVNITISFERAIHTFKPVNLLLQLLHRPLSKLSPCLSLQDNNTLDKVRQFES